MADKMFVVADLLRFGAAEIHKFALGETAALDASLLLSHVLGVSRERLILNRREIVSAEASAQYCTLIERRCLGEPVAYLTGKKSFWLYDFYVTPDVLIPKPDTELLVEKALEICNAALAGIRSSFFSVADVCTGSGCVALSVAAHYNTAPEIVRFLRLIATDISPAALAIAQKNADALLTADTRLCLSFINADLLDISPRVPEGFDLIVSNPPYVPSSVAHELLLDGRREPLLALDGGSDGLDLIRRLVPQSFASLKEGGTLLMETGEYNAVQTRELLCETGFVAVQTFTDLAGMPRVTQGLKPQKN